MAANVEGSKAADAKVVSIKSIDYKAFLVLSRNSNAKNPKAFYNFSSFNFRCCQLNIVGNI